MEQTILIVYLVVAIALVGIILLQQGKGAEMGASFGAGGANTVFGAAGSGNAMTKATTILAILFFATAMAISYINSSPEVVVDQLFVDEKAIEKVDLDSELPMSTDSIESATPTDDATMKAETAPVDPKEASEIINKDKEEPKS
ncbi:MAG: preprotein translocase subunit SecG [Gammaproteobacteria bacterium]|nr:MAG: preprotein translocase subunit SecG [Gammaproteobacteria bacterium]